MTKRIVDPNTKWFVYENLNPKGKHTGDCTIRALANALGETYKNTLESMVTLSLQTGYAINDPKLLKHKLKMFTELKSPRHPDKTKYTGKQFCEEFNKGVYICHMGSHHLTVVIDGKVHDIWDCTDKCVGKVWKIK